MANCAVFGCPPEFGFHRSLHGLKVRIEADGLTVTKLNPEANYSHGIAISEVPLSGEAYFEIEIKDHGTPWSGSFKIGLIQVPAGCTAFEIPRYSPQCENTWVWTNRQLFVRQESFDWGVANIEELEKGDRVAFRIRSDGTLFFFAKGKCLGEAFRNVYMPDKDLYALVDVYGKGRQLSIVRSFCLPSTLFSLCCLTVVKCLPEKNKEQHLHKLVLPRTIKALIEGLL